MVIISMLIIMMGMVMTVLNSDILGSITYDTRPRGYKSFDVLTFMSRKKAFQAYLSLAYAEFLDRVELQRLEH